MGKYPEDWDQRRRTVYQRDGYRCQRCGVGGGPNGNFELHAHHIVPISQGGSHDYDNLITLCRSCHNAIHGDFFAPQWVGSDDLDGTMPEPSKLPREVQPYFEYGHAYNAVVEVYDDTIANLNELDEMLEVAVSLNEEGESLSDEFHETDTRMEQKLLRQLSKLDSRKDEFLGCSTTSCSTDLRQLCNTFEDELTDSIDACQEYADQRRKVVRGIAKPVEVEASSNSSTYEQMLERRETHSELVEASQETLLELKEEMVGEINDELAEYPGISVHAGDRPAKSTSSSSGGDVVMEAQGEELNYDDPVEIPDFSWIKDLEGKDWRTLIRVVTGYWLLYYVLVAIYFVTGFMVHGGALHTFLNILLWGVLPFALYSDGEYVNNTADTTLWKTWYGIAAFIPIFHVLVGMMYLQRRQKALQQNQES